MTKSCDSLAEMYLQEIRWNLLAVSMFALSDLTWRRVSGRILHDKSLPPSARVHLLNLLSVATMKDDFILILHQVHNGRLPCEILLQILVSAKTSKCKENDNDSEQ